MAARSSISTAEQPRSTKVLGFEYYPNAARHQTYGINGAFFSFALGIINGFYPGGRVEKNYLAGAPRRDIRPELSTSHHSKRNSSTCRTAITG